MINKKYTFGAEFDVAQLLLECIHFLTQLVENFVARIVSPFFG